MELWPRIENHTIYEKEILSANQQNRDSITDFFSNRKIENKLCREYKI